MADIKVEMEKIRKEGQERVAATGQTICVFADNVPANIAEDILAGMRLMTELANKKFDKETQQREWYNFYNDGLIKFGWTMTGAGTTSWSGCSAAFRARAIESVAASGPSTTPGLSLGS